MRIGCKTVGIPECDLEMLLILIRHLDLSVTCEWARHIIAEWDDVRISILLKSPEGFDENEGFMQDPELAAVIRQVRDRVLHDPRLLSSDYLNSLGVYPDAKYIESYPRDRFTNSMSALLNALGQFWR